MKDKWRIMLNHVGNFLLNTFNREFLTFLVFLAISTIFWFVIALNETYEKEINVPMSITNVPSNIIITDGISDTVRITVKARGYFLLPYYYGDAMEPINIDFKSVNKGNGKGTITNSDLQKLIYPMLDASTKIISIKAEHMEFYYNYGLSKKVPVIIDGNIKPTEQYYLSSKRALPDSVLVYASNEQLDSISEVYTVEMNEADFTEPITRTVALRKIRGAKIVPDSVSVTLTPDLLTETVVTIPVTPVNTPKGYILRTFPSSVNVKVVVGRSKLASVRPGSFRVIADYREVANHPSDKCSLLIQQSPKGITSAALEVQQVDYLIEKVE